MQSLQASTRNAAEFMGTLDTMGTVEEGKTADLVLLRANPLEDIHNTTKIEAVIFDGHLYDRKDLDEMLENAKRAAAPGKTDELQSDKRFDGTWKGTVPGPDGTPLEITYELESSGNYLSGTISTKLGEGPFTGGKIEGEEHPRCPQPSKVGIPEARALGIVRGVSASDDPADPPPFEALQRFDPPEVFSRGQGRHPVEKRLSENSQIVGYQSLQRSELAQRIFLQRYKYSPVG